MTTFDPRANAQDFLNLPPPPGRIETQPVTQPATEPPAKAKTRNSSLVVIRLSIPASARRLLDDIAEREGVSRGAAAMKAFVAEKERVLADNTLPDPGDFLASPPTRKRPPLVDPVTVALYISPTQAAALTEFKERVTLSISGLITESIERYCGAKN
jgi:hypothetical protein